MRKLKCFLTLLCDISLVYCVPPDYCNRPLNTSDCKGKPTRVFAYYKPGSRCEIETWKGCPTQNKFPSEIACVNLCIFRFNTERNEEPMVKDKGNEKMKIDFDDIPYDDSTENDIPKLCQGKLNTTKCQETIKTVFTYDHEEERCIEANWYVCPTKNMFNTRQQCIKTCEEQNDGLVQFLKHKTTGHFVLLDKLLNDIVDNIAVVDESEQVTDNQKLHNEVIVTEAVETTLETLASTKSSATEKITILTAKPTETPEDNNEIDRSKEVKSSIAETRATSEASSVTEASVKTTKVTETEYTTITVKTSSSASASAEASTAPTETKTSKVTETAKLKTSKVTKTAKPKTRKVTETVKPETGKVTETDKSETSKATTEVTSKATDSTSNPTTVKKKPTEVLILTDDENEMIL